MGALSEGHFKKYISFFIFLANIHTEGEQNRLTQNLPLWHVDCFELKVIKIEQTQEKLLPLP